MPRGAQLRGEEKRQSLTVRVDPSIINQIEKKMDQLGVSKTALVENLLINGLGFQDIPTIVAGNQGSAQEDNSNSVESDNPISSDYQEGFDAGHGFGLETGNKLGRDELMKELSSMDIANTPDPNGSEESHKDSFKPWIETCTKNGCENHNPEFVKGLKRDMEIACKECYEILGQVQDVFNLKECPHCEEKDDFMTLAPGVELEANESE